jgi:outer membrane protein OmpA-like peptidoglycan-associated protein
MVNAQLGQHKATVMIEGQTDSTGSSDYNLRLSKQRAESVESLRTQECVAEGRLESPVPYSTTR